MDKKTLNNSFDVTIRGLTKLKNYEIFNLHDDVTQRLEQHSFESEFIRMCVAVFQSHRKTVELLKAWKRAHDLSELIDERFDKCRDMLIGIRGSIDAAVKFDKPETRNEVRLLVNWIKDVRGDLGVNSKSQQKDNVQTLTKRVNADTELAEAIETIGLSSEFNQVIRLQSEIATYRELRDIDNNYSRDVRDGFRTRLLNDLRLLLAGFEAMAIYGPEDEQGQYIDLCIGLEKLLVTACTPPKARATRSKNEKDAESDMLPEEGIDTTPDSAHNPDAGNIEDGNVNDDPSVHVEDENNEQSL